MSYTGAIQIGPIRLQFPAKHELISTYHDPRNELDRLVAASPDHTLYHLRPYTEFLRQQGCPAEMLAVTKSGELIFAMPVEPQSSGCFDSGFYGMLFPASSSEKALKRAVGTVFELLALNDHIRRYDSVQTILSKGAQDPARRALLDYLLTTQAPAGSTSHLFTRVIDLGAATNPSQRVDASGTL